MDEAQATPMSLQSTFDPTVMISPPADGCDSQQGALEGEGKEKYLASLG